MAAPSTVAQPCARINRFGLTRGILILYGYCRSRPGRSDLGDAPSCFLAGEPSSTASADPIAILAVILAVASASLASQVTGALSAGGWTDPDSESAAVAQRLEDEFGAGGGAIVALFEGSGR